MRISRNETFRYVAWASTGNVNTYRSLTNLKKTHKLSRAELSENFLIDTQLFLAFQSHTYFLTAVPAK